MSRNLPINGFKWVGGTSQFNEDFAKSYSEERDEGYFLKMMSINLKNYLTFAMI